MYKKKFQLITTNIGNILNYSMDNNYKIIRE